MGSVARDERDAREEQAEPMGSVARDERDAREEQAEPMGSVARDERGARVGRSGAIPGLAGAGPTGGCRGADVVRELARNRECADARWPG